MQTEPLHYALKDLADVLVPPSTDLWPKIISHLGEIARAKPHFPRPQMSHSLARRLRFGAAVIAVILVVAAVACAATPLGRATLEGLLERFGFVLIETKQLLPSTSQGAEVKLGAPALLPVAEIQAQSPFHIPTPQWLPPGLQLLGGSIQSGPAESGSPTQTGRTVVFLEFGSGTPDPTLKAIGLAMLINTPPGSALHMLIPASNSIATNVNEMSALCVKGAWDSATNTASGESLGNLNWNAAADQVALSWEAGGLAYSIWANGLRLECKDLVRVAESLH